MQIAADVAARHQRRQRRRGWRAAISSSPFADLRRDERQAERRVDLLLSRPPARSVPSAAVQAVGAQAPAASRRRARAAPRNAPRDPVRWSSVGAGVRRLRQADADLHAVDSRYSRRSLRCSTRDDARAGRASASMASAGCDRSAATISMSPTVSCPRRSDPTGAAHTTPGDAAQPFEHRLGDAHGAAERNARNRARAASAAPPRRRLRRFASRPGSVRSCCSLDRGGEVGRRRGAERAVNRGELLDRDRARFVEPAQIGRQVGERRLDQHPAAGLVHLAQPLQHFGIGVRRRVRRAADRRRRRIRCCARARSAAARVEHRSRPGRRGSSPANASCSSVAGRAYADVARKSPGIARLAFQCARFRRRLLGRLFGFGRQIGGEPVGDAALQRDGPIALPDAARPPRRCWPARSDPSRRPRSRDRAAATARAPSERGWRPAASRCCVRTDTSAGRRRERAARRFEPLLEIFFGDAGNRHGCVL